MNSIIRRSNTITPNFNLNDSSPISYQKKQKLETLHAEIQGEQLSKFTKQYRHIVRQESQINSPTHHNEQISNNHNIHNNGFQSRQTLDLSELNDENHSRVSFEILSPLKRTSKSLGLIKQYQSSSAFPQFSTNISLQQNSDLKSPQYSQSSKKLDFSPSQRCSMRQNQPESFRRESDASPMIKMQNTFYQKQNKQQNQQFLEKCFDSVTSPIRVNGFQTPQRSSKYVPFNISSTQNINDRKLETNSFYKAIRAQDMDFLTRINNESQITIKTEQTLNKAQRTTSLTVPVRSKQSYEISEDKKTENNKLERFIQSPFKKSTKLVLNSSNRSQNSTFLHKERDFTMINPLNFSKHLQNLQDLSQSDRKRRKIIGLVDQMVKQRQKENEQDSARKPFKIILQQDTPNTTLKNKESNNPSSRRSSIELSEQLHYFKKPRKQSVIREAVSKNEITSNPPIGSQQNIIYPIQSQKQIITPQSSLSIIIEKSQIDVQFEDRVQQCIKIAADAFNQLQKLLSLNISRQKIIQHLKNFLAGNSPVLNILLDENKINLEENLNVQMFEDLIIPRDPQNKDENLLIEHELIFLKSKIEEYILQLEIQKCEIYKSEILNECQNLQEMASKVSKKNKQYSLSALQTLDSLSFMGNDMLNKQHSVIDQLNKVQLKFGKLTQISQQNMNMNNQIENKIEKMVKLRSGQIKMLDIFNTKKTQQ